MWILYKGSVELLKGIISEVTSCLQLKKLHDSCEKYITGRKEQLGGCRSVGQIQQIFVLDI